MAPKRAAKSSAPPPRPPPAAASSEESDSRSTSEESEDEETTVVSPAPASKNPPTPPQKVEESETSDEEEEEEEEESGEEPTHAAPPSAPKNAPPPRRQSEESDTSDEEEEEGESSESEEEAPPPTKPPTKQEAKDLKPPSSGEAKKPGAPFHRIWSTDDEVRILEALAAHLQEHGALPQPDALVDTLAGRLDNRAYGGKELQGKVKSLKHRYVTAAKKSELPSKEHDRRLFDLSKIVWSGDKTAAAPAAAAKANGHEPRGFAEMCDLYPYLAEEVKELEVKHPGMFKREFGKIDDDKARSLESKIKKQRVVQMKVELRRGDLTKEVTKTLVDLVD